MFRPQFFKGGFTGLKKYLYTHCDEDAEDDGPSLIKQADAALEDEKRKIRTPMQYENLKGSLGQGQVNSYDGFRLIVQKQVNLNTAVLHTYWVGSQAMEKPFYQYRLILPIDNDRTINVSTDLDMNVEGEVKATVAPNVTVKSNFANGDNAKSISLELELADATSATQIKYTKSTDDQFYLSYMQSIIPQLAIGGSGVYSTKSKDLSTSMGLIYDPAEYTFAVQWDNSLRLLYLKKVNPNRVHLSTDLTVDEAGNGVMSLNAEYMLKQSKIHMGIDSNLVLKSYLEAELSPKVTLQMCAEMQQATNHYRVGAEIRVGGCP
ncbi:eukaryotic porin-domain-containing protein [Ochromonadaceae sp. CCMP2298]|nr:eukaryotic porin-domain-containing protein [Ochromonadaceae sp. CCMP2298]